MVLFVQQKLCTVMQMQRSRSSDISGLLKIEYVFYNAELIRTAINEIRNAGRPANETGRRSENKISDITGNDAVRNLTPLKMILIKEQILYNPEEWLQVYDKTLKWCTQRGKYLNVFKGRYGNEHFAKTCANAEITQDTYYRILEKIRYYAAMTAAYLHLIFLD